MDIFDVAVFLLVYVRIASFETAAGHLRPMLPVLFAPFFFREFGPFPIF